MIMHYRVESRLQGVWIMYEERGLATKLSDGRSRHSERLCLCKGMPRFEKSPLAPEGASATLEYDRLLFEANLKFDKNRRLESSEIRHSIDDIQNSVETFRLTMKMLDLITRDAYEFLK
jgi:hypothetical protein